MKPFPLDEILDFWTQFVKIIINFLVLVLLVPASTIRQIMLLVVEQMLVPMERAGHRQLATLRGELNGYQNPIR